MLPSRAPGAHPGTLCTNGQSINQVTKHAEIQQMYDIDKVVDMLVVMQRQVPRIQIVEDCGRPVGAVRRHSHGGADGMRQVACPKMQLPHHVRRGRRMR